jgi:hypothetical protein
MVGLTLSDAVRGTVWLRHPIIGGTLNNKFLLEPVPKVVARPSFFVKITSGDQNDTISTCIEGANNHD